MMDISEAKQQVKNTIEAYLACDDRGTPLLETSRQRPVFLVGAPGIGKTAIMSQIASELEMGLVSYSMTHHTRQSALGLPFITEESYKDYSYQASEYTMSEIVASVYEYMKETGLEQGILFLDEINCVSETLYPSMLQFLQFKTFGRHKVPEGWIVVTAGNPPEYNRSVHEFDIVTLDRLKRIDVEPSLDAWKAYAVSRETHPAILTFLEIKKDCFYRVETSLDGASFVTARGWDDLSEIMKVFEKLGKPVDYDLIIQYVQNEAIAREFASYYELFNKYREDYQIEEILKGTSSSEVLDRAQAAEFDERLSIIGLLLDAICGDMAELMHDTDVSLALRDTLREVKEDLAEDLSIDVTATLERLATERRVRRDVLEASGNLSRLKKAMLDDEIDRLIAYSVAAREAKYAPFEAVEKAYAAHIALLQEHAAGVEKSLANAFAFLNEAFGDAQEMLVFVTELTSRTASARFVAQYGSESYFDHNSGMILSERQLDLRRRAEELDL